MHTNENKMLDGTCPNCGSHDIYADTNIRNKSNYRHAAGAIASPGFIASIAYFDHFTCIRCGYTESYISDPIHLQEIAQHWTKIKLNRVRTVRRQSEDK